MALETRGPQVKVSQDYFFYTKVSASGSILIPTSLRNSLGLSEGTWVRAYAFPKEPPSGFIEEDTDIGLDDPVARAKQRRHVDG